MLNLERCTAAWDGYPVFSSLSLNARRGDIITLLGPSGCGKSTLLAVMAGIKQPDSGRVLLDGESVQAGDHRVSLIFQDYGLFPWFTAIDNAALGLKIRGLGRRQGREIARAALASVGLAGLEGRWPAQLSGGQRQRVAIARSLVLEPDLLLMDEPFSALDSMSRESIQELSWSLLSSRPTISILVTHSVEEAAFLGTRILVMSQGPNGRILELPGLPDRDRGGLRSQPAFFELCRAIRSTMEEPG